MTPSLLLVVASLWALTVAQVPILSRTIPDTFGVNIHWMRPLPGEMEMLAATGWKWVRRDLTWSSIETVKGQYNFSQYDVVASNLLAHGVKALFILDYSNPLYDNGLSPFDDEGRTAFANYAVAAVTHYQGKGFIWEMFNEPNGGFWKPKPNSTAYTELALTVGQALKTAHPNEIYIGAALSTFDWPYLNATLRGGVLKYFDCYSMHPYRNPAPPETATADFQELRRVLDLYAPAGKYVPIISSEWGYSTQYSEQNLESQGKLLPRMLLNNLANHVDLSIFYDWHDDCTDPTNVECHFGTVFYEYLTNQTNPYNPKPDYISAQTMMSLLSGYEFSEIIPQSNADDYVFSFVNSGKIAYAAWTLDPNHTISFPVNGSCFASTTYLGHKMAQVCSSGGRVKIDLSDAPLYLTPQ